MYIPESDDDVSFKIRLYDIFFCLICYVSSSYLTIIKVIMIDDDDKEFKAALKSSKAQKRGNALS